MFTSPLQRAARTCALAGFGGVAEDDALELVECNYGDYEGIKTAWISTRSGRIGIYSSARLPGRRVRCTRSPCAPTRAIEKLREVDGDVLCFSSGHFLRALAGTWLGLGASGGRYFMLSTTSLSALSYEHNRDEPVIKLWDETGYLNA